MSKLARNLVGKLGCLLMLVGCGETPGTGPRPDASGLRDVRLDVLESDVSPPDAVAEVSFDTSFDGTHEPIALDAVVGTALEDTAALRDSATASNRCFGAIRMGCTMRPRSCLVGRVPEIVDQCYTGACIDPVTDCSCTGTSGAMCGDIRNFTCRNNMCTPCGGLTGVAC